LLAYRNGIFPGTGGTDYLVELTRFVLFPEKLEHQKHAVCIEQW
jgi:hypothetical protein